MIRLYHFYLESKNPNVRVISYLNANFSIFLYLIIFIGILLLGNVYFERKAKKKRNILLMGTGIIFIIAILFDLIAGPIFGVEP